MAPAPAIGPLIQCEAAGRDVEIFVTGPTNVIRDREDTHVSRRGAFRTGWCGRHRSRRKWSEDAWHCDRGWGYQGRGGRERYRRLLRNTTHGRDERTPTGRSALRTRCHS